MSREAITTKNRTKREIVSSTHALTMLFLPSLHSLSLPICLVCSHTRHYFSRCEDRTVRMEEKERVVPGFHTPRYATNKSFEDLLVGKSFVFMQKQFSFSQTKTWLPLKSYHLSYVLWTEKGIIQLLDFYGTEAFVLPGPKRCCYGPGEPRDRSYKFTEVQTFNHQSIGHIISDLSDNSMNVCQCVTCTNYGW